MTSSVKGEDFGSAKIQITMTLTADDLSLRSQCKTLTQLPGVSATYEMPDKTRQRFGQPQAALSEAKGEDFGSAKIRITMTLTAGELSLRIQ